MRSTLRYMKKRRVKLKKWNKRKVGLGRFKDEFKIRTKRQDEKMT